MNVKSLRRVQDSDCSHVIDILPTTLDFTGIKAPEQIKGIRQATVERTSSAYSIDDAKAPSRHTLQYYYIFGSRSIYHDGWKAELAYQNSSSISWN
jgi:arylsulfatase